jgi:hypothetical protein
MNVADDIVRLQARLDALEAARAVEGVMVRYMALCDSLGPATPMDELAGLFTHDAVWEGRGARYGAAFGVTRGRDAIAAMLGRYRGPSPHFAFNAHYLTSGAVEVDGVSAHGRWMMLQASTYANGASDLRSARLEVDFALEDGRWRIARFCTEALFARPVDAWDTASVVPVPPAQEG